jgi:hypothetical protein
MFLLRLGVPGVMHFGPLGKETFAAPLTPPGESRPPAFGAHARAETVLILSGALRALKSAFHGDWLLKSRYLTGDARPVNSPSCS